MYNLYDVRLTSNQLALIITRLAEEEPALSAEDTLLSIGTIEQLHEIASRENLTTMVDQETESRDAKD